MLLNSFFSARWCYLVPLLSLLALTGCRTYGGYDSEPLTLDQMQTATQQFAENLEQARSDLSLLEAATATNPALDPLEQTYRTTVTLHAEKLDHHRRIVEEFNAADGSYRALSRNYGAIISDQRLVQQRYRSLLARISRTVRGVDPQPAPEMKSRYSVAPIFYSQAERELNTLTMNEALRGS